MRSHLVQCIGEENTLRGIVAQSSTTKCFSHSNRRLSTTSKHADNKGRNQECTQRVD